MPSTETIEHYLHNHIPITKSLGIKVITASANEVTLWAPFANNINHKSTVFGGSLHSVVTLAGWSLLYTHLQSMADNYEIIITHSDIDYLMPVTQDFTATALAPTSIEWDKFIKMLTKKGKGKIELQATILQNNKLAVDFRGVFAAFRR